jgi:hypothetical protein
MKPQRYWMCAILFAYFGSPLAAQTLTLPQHIWDSLEAGQKDVISERYIVNVIPGSSYGIILDAQTMNQSTPGTTSGSQLGGAYGSAIYVDRAFSGKNRNYSATDNLTAGIIGAMIGSLADKPPQAVYRTRYTIQDGNGGVSYVEETKADAFRHSVGLCVALSPLRLIDLDRCRITREQFLTKINLLPNPSAPIGRSEAEPPAIMVQPHPTPSAVSAPAPRPVGQPKSALACAGAICSLR